MFEVKKSEATNKTIRLPIELIDRLNEIATSKGVSFNNLVLQCIEYALNDLADDPKPATRAGKKKG